MKQNAEYENRMSNCPVCGACDVHHDALRSTAGFMSLPDVNHSRCDVCGSYFVNPQPTEAALGAFYEDDHVEDVVEERILRGSIDRYLNVTKRHYFIENRIRPLQSHIPAGAKVLDVGCGAGVFVKFMKDAGYDTRGIDVSDRSIRFGKINLQLSYEIGKADWHEAEGGPYDLVTAWTLIEHLKEPRAFLQHVHGLLREQGCLIVEFPTVDSLLFEQLQESFYWVMPYYHLFLFSRKGMRQMLRTCGFEVEEEYNMPRNWNFVASIVKELGGGNESLLNDEYFMKVASKADEIFDNVALQTGKSSSVQFICRKRRIHTL